MAKPAGQCLRSCATNKGENKVVWNFGFGRNMCVWIKLKSDLILIRKATKTSTKPAGPDG
jgi:hypothetical protein